MLREINIIKKTGFETSDPVILIYDNNLNIFYKKENKSGKFNLPKGFYFTRNNVKETKPINYKIILPKTDLKPKFNLKNLHLVLNDNPHKASINTATGKILFNAKILQGSKTDYYFIFFHEIGHLFFNTEKKCDDFATAKLLSLGFNPSQIFKASKNTLSKKNYQRIENTFNKVKF
jgi:hypothetical protein